MFLFLALAYSQNKETRCFSTCPPWFTVCTRDCADRPWYEQEKWQKELMTNASFLAKSLAYLDVPNASTCYSACPPWYEVCTLQCLDKPWYLQKQWVDKLATDKDFAEEALKYLPTLLQDTNGECHSACPPWFTTCSMRCMSQPWYLQEQWVELMKTDPQFAAKAIQYIPMLLSENTEFQCYSACPPWYEKCTRQCMDKPWFEQDQWKELLASDEEFRAKAMQYFARSEQNGECHSTCPPWFEICTLDCSDKPWYEQEEWVKMMESDPEFKKQALAYIPMPIESNSEFVCYSACPPWYEKCTRQCMDKPWFEQDQWKELLATDEEFRAKAMQYFARSVPSNVCHSVCPPWYDICPMRCSDKPWYEQEEWIEKMDSDSEFKKKALAYIPMPIESNSEFVCYSACPPWYERCTRQCMDKPWYEQDQWVELMKTDGEFAAKALAYIPMPIGTENNECYSACPPWYDICTRQCMDKPWYVQEKWMKLMETDPVFAEQALAYIPKPISNTTRRM